MTAGGYAFGGWFKEAGCTNAWDFAKDTVTGNMTLYAKWTQVPVNAPVITSITPTGAVYGYTEGTAKVEIVVKEEAEHTYTYQWYSNTENANTGGTAISGATKKEYLLPAGMNAGDSYYYCVITANKNGQTAVTTSNAVKVTIEKKELQLTWSNIKFTYDGTAKIPTAAVTGFLGSDTAAVKVEGEQTNANTAGASYTATASIDSQNYKLPEKNTTAFTIEKANMVVSADMAKVGDGYGIKVTVTKPSGEITIKYGETAGNYNLTASPVYKTSVTKTVYYQVIDQNNNYNTYTGSAIVDMEAPTGSIEVDEKTSTGFVSSISFGTYFSDTQEVFIDIDDSGSGPDEIYYYVTQTPVSATQIKALSEDKWQLYEYDLELTKEQKYIVYAKLTDMAGNVRYDRSPVSTSVKISFVIDEGGDPYGDMLTVISQYVAVKGMVCTDIDKGYTYSDPSSSITGYEGAPAWDDQILKSDSDWKEKCLWLIDEYAKRGFTKVSFIETSSAFGFSAAQ